MKDILKDKEKDSERIGLDLSFFRGDDAIIRNIRGSSYAESESNTPKRGRPRKKTDTIVKVEGESKNLSIHQSNTPYSNTYLETDMMLKSAIVQIDNLNGDISEEIKNIKGSKTIKRRYEYLSELSGTSSNLLGTKISAIRELNKSITDSHNLELRRIKDLKLNENEQDDNKHIMDMYNAFISTPVGNFPQFGPSIHDISTVSNIVRVDQENTSTGDPGYDSYLRNMTPEQHRMILESNPNIKTVVVYNQETQEKWFDVIDASTGASIPNVAKPSAFLLDKMYLDIRNGSARNSESNENYQLIVVGNKSNIYEY